MQLVQADTAEAVWAVVGLALLALTASAIGMAVWRREWSWVVLCLVFGPLGAAAYLFWRFNAARPPSAPARR